MELVTVTEVKNSNAMEKEGLVRGLKAMKDNGITVKELITDRHGEIRKYLRENEKKVKHSLDVWHVAKGLGKKLDKMGIKTGMEPVNLWKRSIRNHIYWVASSSADQTSEVMVAKWESVANHIQNKHRHTNPLYPRCEHKRLTGPDRKKKWMTPNTEVTEALVDLITKKSLLKDVAMLSTGDQTYSVESEHAVQNHFAPKLIAYSHGGMQARLRLAALHYNENSYREQAMTQDGIPQVRVVYPKYKKGACSLKKVLVKCTYNYVKELKATVYDMVMNGDKPVRKPICPPTITSGFERRPKAEVVADHKSRYRTLKR